MRAGTNLNAYPNPPLWGESLTYVIWVIFLNFDGARIDVFQIFSIPEIINLNAVRDQFIELTQTEQYLTILKKALENRINRELNIYFKHIGRLHLSTNNPWNMILRTWKSLMNEFNVVYLPLVPLRTVSQRPVFFKMINNNCKYKGKLIIDWFPPFIFCLRMSLDINHEIEYDEIINIIRNFKSLKTYYKSFVFESKNDFAVFIKNKIIESIFNQKYTSKISSILSSEIYFVQLKGTETFKRGKSKELVAIALHRKDPTRIPEETIKKILNSKISFYKNDFIFLTPHGLYMYSPLMYSNVSKSLRKNLRRKIIYGVLSAFVAQEYMRKIAIFTECAIKNNLNELYYIIINMAISFNPYLLTGNKAQITLLNPPALRKIFEKLAEILELYESYETSLRAFINATRDVVLPDYVIALNEINKIQPPMFVDLFRDISDVLTRNVPLEIIEDKLEKYIGHLATKVLSILVREYINDSGKVKPHEEEMEGFRKIATLKRLLEKELRDMHKNQKEKEIKITTAELYGTKQKFGIIRILDLYNLIETKKVRSRGPKGEALMIRININNPIIQTIIKKRMSSQ